jgi:hypothetical protein
MTSGASPRWRRRVTPPRARSTRWMSAATAAVRERTASSTLSRNSDRSACGVPGSERMVGAGGLTRLGNQYGPSGVAGAFAPTTAAARSRIFMLCCWETARSTWCATSVPERP